jgi:hypothetical protein
MMFCHIGFLDSNKNGFNFKIHREKWSESKELNNCKSTQAKKDGFKCGEPTGFPKFTPKLSQQWHTLYGFSFILNSLQGKMY